MRLGGKAGRAIRAVSIPVRELGFLMPWFAARREKNPPVSIPVRELGFLMH